MLNTMHGNYENTCFIKVYAYHTYMSDTKIKEGEIEIRRLQALTGERSLTLVFPKQFAIDLGIGKGDFLKCHVDGNRLIVEKVNP
jgi:hypothetical protein